MACGHELLTVFIFLFNCRSQLWLRFLLHRWLPARDRSYTVFSGVSIRHVPPYGISGTMLASCSPSCKMFFTAFRQLPYTAPRYGQRCIIENIITKLHASMRATFQQYDTSMRGNIEYSIERVDRHQATKHSGKQIDSICPQQGQYPRHVGSLFQRNVVGAILVNIINNVLYWSVSRNMAAELQANAPSSTCKKNSPSYYNITSAMSKTPKE